VHAAVSPGCTFELTEVVAAGQAWWTLGFEASGSAETLDPSLRICTDLVLGSQPHDRVELPADQSMSYVAWLSIARRHAGQEDFGERKGAGQR